MNTITVSLLPFLLVLGAVLSPLMGAGLDRCDATTATFSASDAGAETPPHSLASQCEDIESRRLAMNRSEHQQLLDDFAMYAQMQSLRLARQSRVNHGRRHAAFIALVEAFSHHRQDPDAITTLNRIYETTAEIARLRLKGYTNQADALEKRAFSVEDLYAPTAITQTPSSLD